jgi:hypothetical protein
MVTVLFFRRSFPQSVVSALVILTSWSSCALAAGAPTWVVGDTWTIERPETNSDTVLRVVAVENDVMVITGFQQCPRCRAYLDRHLAPLKLVDEAGTVLSSAPGLFSWGYPSWKYLDWPLEVKKTWRIDADASMNKRVTRFTVDMSVRAHEDIATKAGTFAAFRISREWQSGPWKMSETLW